MVYSTALVGIFSPAEPTLVQKKEFHRLAELYAQLVDSVMAAWLQRIRTTPCVNFTEDDARYLTVQFRRKVQAMTWNDPQERDFASCALRDTLRRLSEHYRFGCPLPHAIQDPIVIRCYRFFDVRVTKGYSVLPLIGRVEIGRFPYFKGKIVCTGLEADHQGTIRAVVMYDPEVGSRSTAA